MWFQVKRGVCEWLAWCLRMQRPGKDITRKKIIQNSKMRDMELRERSSKSLLANVLDLDDDFRGNNSNHTFTNNTSHSHCKLDDTTHFENVMYPGRSELKEILKELRFLTTKIKKDDEYQDACNDWKFAAMVIDRLCLWMFTVFTVTSTCGILFSAPHLFVWMLRNGKIDGFVQDCNNSIANAIELLQSCTKP